MPRIPRTITFALSVLLASTATVTARAESTKTGFLCGFMSVTDPLAPPHTTSGLIDGGPLLIVDDTDPTAVHTGHLTCTIQVGWANSTHAGIDSVSVQGQDTPGVVSVPETPVNYVPAYPEFLCTSVTTEEGTWYFDESYDPVVDGTWSTDPTTARCAMRIYSDCCDEGPLPGLIDSIVCPVLATLQPGVPGVVDIDSEGDLTVLGIPFWDCPPYEDR